MAIKSLRRYCILVSIMAGSASFLYAQYVNTVPVPGSTSALSLSPASSVGGSAVNYSLPANDPSVAVSGAVTNVTVDAVSGALSQNGASGGGGGSARRSPNGNPMAAASASSATGPHGAASRSELRALAKNLPASSLASIGLQHSVTADSSSAHALGSLSASAGNSLSQASGGLNDKAYTSASAGGANNPTYTSDFPDSTQNTAVLSPAVNSDSPIAEFNPQVAAHFPDLSTYQFLKPTLTVRGGKSSARQEEDLYKRIERRLNDYREAEMPAKGMKPSGMKQSNPFPNPFANPFGAKTSDKSEDGTSF